MMYMHTVRCEKKYVQFQSPHLQREGNNYKSHPYMTTDHLKFCSKQWNSSKLIKFFSDFTSLKHFMLEIIHFPKSKEKQYNSKIIYTPNNTKFKMKQERNEIRTGAKRHEQGKEIKEVSGLPEQGGGCPPGWL